MSSLVEFWQEQHVDVPLESDSRIRRFLNSFVVAPLMNRFPRAAVRIFSRSRGELARRLFVRREGGSFPVLRTMYRFEDAHERGDLLNRILMQSPAVKAARNRRKIARKMLEDCLRTLPAGMPKLVLAIGGGDGSLEAEAIASVSETDIYYCGIDRDRRAVAENQTTLRKYGLTGRGLTVTGRVNDYRDIQDILCQASERFGVEIREISVAVCQGIIEYLDIGSEGNEALAGLLLAIRACTRSDGNLLISQTDFHDRVQFLEDGLKWHMRLRSLEEVAAQVEKAQWHIAICQKEPMDLITMCLACKSEVQRTTLPTESPVRRPHLADHAARQRQSGQKYCSVSMDLQGGSWKQEGEAPDEPS